MAIINADIRNRDDSTIVGEVYGFLVHDSECAPDKYFCLVPESPTVVIVLDESYGIIERACKPEMTIRQFCDKWGYVLDEVYPDCADFTITIDVTKRK